MIKLIWAMDENNLIGNKNNLPWHYKEDLRYFKEQTTGHDCLMGYNTYLSIVNRLGHPLPNRENFVLYKETINNELVHTVTNLEEFLKEYEKTDKDLFVIGGASVYQQCFEKADYLYITRIHKAYTGDVYFNNLNLDDFIKISEVISGELSFEIYKRK